MNLPESTNISASPISAPSLARALKLELLVFVACAGYLLFATRDILFHAVATLSHDNLYWTLPVFSFFAEGVRNGDLRLWNAYSHGGEPLAPLYLHLRMLDPISLFVAYAGQWFTDDLVVLAGWDRIIKAIVSATGSYILLRRFTERLLVRLSLGPILLWSSFTLNFFWQNGILDQFCYAPFFVHFLLNILWKRDYAWHNWIGSALTFGLQLQSYFFVGATLILICTVAGFVLYRRADLGQLFRHCPNRVRVAVAILIVLALAGPQLSVYQDLKDYDFPARVRADDGNKHAWKGYLSAAGNYDSADSIKMPYSVIQGSGAFSRVQDFFGLFAPAAVYFRMVSEASVYLGGLVLVGSLYGLFQATHPLKPLWAGIGAFMFLMMLGPGGGLHWVAYHVLPPLWFIRNTEQLVNFFLLAVIFLYVIGANRWLDLHDRRSSEKAALSEKPKSLHRKRTAAVLIAAGLFLGVIPYVMGLNEITRLMPMFNSIQLVLSVTLIAALLVIRYLESIAAVPLIMLGMFAVASFLGIGELLWLWAYAGFAVLLPYLLAASVRNPEEQISQLASSPYTGVRIVSLVHYLWVVLALCTFWPLLRLDAVMGLVHLWLALTGAISILGILKPDRLVAAITPSRMPVTRLVALLGCAILLLALRRTATEAPIEQTAFVLLNNHVYSLFVWSVLIVAYAAVALWLGKIVKTVTTLHTASAGWRTALDAMLFCALPVSLLTVTHASLRGDSDLLNDGLIIGVFYLALLIVRSIMYRQKYRESEQPLDVLFRSVSFSIKRASPWVLLAILALDLAFQPSLHESLWRAERPDPFYQVQTHVGSPQFPTERKVTPSTPPEMRHYLFYSRQMIRYLDLFERTPSMLDVPANMATPLPSELPGVITELVGSPAWNGLFQMKSYTALIRSGLSAETLQDFFAVGMPLIRYYPCAVKADNVLSFVRDGWPVSNVSLAKEVVILNEAENDLKTCLVRYAGNKVTFDHRISSYDYNTLRLEIETSQPGHVYYADSYDRHWKAKIDGKDVPILRANFHFKAVPIRAGKHTIEFSYEPSLLMYAIVIYLLTLLLGMMGWIVSYRWLRQSG